MLSNTSISLPLQLYIMLKKRDWNKCNLLPSIENCSHLHWYEQYHVKEANINRNAGDWRFLQPCSLQLGYHTPYTTMERHMNSQFSTNVSMHS